MVLLAGIGVGIGMAANLAGAAEYPAIYPRIRNEALREQVLADAPNRFAPLAQTEWVTAAVDGHLFYRSFNGDDPGFYHGGYWFNLFAEIKPTNGIELNTRLVVYNPAFSYGAVSYTALQPLLGLTWKPADERTPDQFRWKFRAGDLDRQTLGAGLSLEDKEMGGLTLEFAQSDLHFRGLVDGTGGFMHAGDLHYLQLDWRNETLGVSAMRTGFTQRIYPALYSRQSLGEYVTYGLEASLGGGSGSGGRIGTLARIQYRRAWDNGWALRLRAENRNYPAGFADGYFEGIESTRGRVLTGAFFPSEIEHDYLAIDQEDKQYADASNLFVIGRDVISSSGLLDVQWEVLPRLSLISVNEIAYIQWRGLRAHTTYLYRHGLRLALDSPRAGAPGARFIELFGSNKSSSAAAQLDVSDLVNKAAFDDRFYIAIEGRLRF